MFVRLLVIDGQFIQYGWVIHNTEHNNLFIWCVMIHSVCVFHVTDIDELVIESMYIG